MCIDEDSEERRQDRALSILVDGEFVEEKKDLRLAFRGSGNQRLIDVKATKRAGHVVCLPE